MKKSSIVLIIVIIIIAAFVFLRGNEDTWFCQNGEWIKHGEPKAAMPESGCGESKITDFNSCAAAGNAIMESYPRQCRAGNQVFAEKIGNELELTDQIQVDYPRPNDKIISPLVIKGQARGYWFFEASFPIILNDAKGQKIGQAIAQAQSDWMTSEFVGFTAQIEFSAPATTIGELILQKDNPSGLPQNAAELKIPIKF